MLKTINIPGDQYEVVDGLLKTNGTSQALTAGGVYACNTAGGNLGTVIAVTAGHIAAGIIVVARDPVPAGQTGRIIEGEGVLCRALVHQTAAAGDPLVATAGETYLAPSEGNGYRYHAIALEAGEGEAPSLKWVLLFSSGRTIPTVIT